MGSKYLQFSQVPQWCWWFRSPAILWEPLSHLNSILYCLPPFTYLLGIFCHELNPRDLLFPPKCYHPGTLLLFLWGWGLARLYFFRNSYHSAPLLNNSLCVCPCFYPGKHRSLLFEQRSPGRASTLCPHCLFVKKSWSICPHATHPGWRNAIRENHSLTALPA